MADYFLLEVYAHELVLHPEGVAAGQDESQQHRANPPFALAFQFLDYPLLLSYAKPGSAGDAPAEPGRSLHIIFGSGKSCVLKEDVDELQYVLEKVRHLHAPA